MLQIHAATTDAHQYIRFTTNEIDPDSGKRPGVCNSLCNLRDDGMLLPWEHERTDEIVSWFNKHLARPGSFNRSTRPHRLEKALSWFKDNAGEHITLMREMAAMLESHAIPVVTLVTGRPGYITY